MACCRTVLAMLMFCIFFILPVVLSLAISSIRVPYDAPVGYEIATVDSNGEDVRLRHVDDATEVFTLSREGQLTLKYPLQTLLEKGRTGVVVVVQHGQGSSEWEEIINVHITGVNNKLHFTESFCIGSVSENSAIGASVHGLEDLSIWRGDAQVLQVHLSGTGSDLFSTEVSSNDGRIKMFTNEIFDREEVSSYNLHLTITGDGPNPETAEADILINIQDENDNFPEFFQTENEFRITLLSPAGTEAGIVQARDRDSGDNGEVSYFLITESPFFAVDAHTGVIYVKEMVNEPGTYHLYLAAQDNGDPSLSSKLAAHVAVAVDLPKGLIPYGDDIVYPMEQMVEFKRARSKRDVDSLAVEVSEHALLGTIIGTVTDYPKPTDKFETDSTLFAVDAITGNISLQTDLNYEEEALYDFTVRVLNTSNPASVQEVQISVSVVDASDPPYWTISISPFIAVVPSNVPQNAPVYRLTAADEDEDADIRYYLRTGDGFYVDEMTGEIKTESGFRYTEEDAPYILSVYAEDVNSLSEDDFYREVNGVVTIFVDQHPPQFAEETYEVSVPEGVPQYEVVTVRAISFSNQRLRYALVDPPQNTPSHNIDEVTGVIELLESLDREALDSYYLEVEATEERGDQLSSIVRVNVKVADSNDNSPKFGHAAYSFDGVREDIGLNQIIGSVQATDPDEGDNGRVFYTLSGEDASYFRVDEEGNLYANRTLDFDKRYESYYFDLKATDGGSPPRSVTASVRVRVIATSDETPVFAPSRYTYYVDETAGADYSIGTVYASDADGETITFSLLEDSDGRFTVEGDTGVIKLTPRAENNLPDAEYSVVVAARDTSGSQQTADVRIIVNDINDNAPQFLDCDSYEPHVTDGQEVIPGQEPLVLQVNATDSDRGSNAELTYRLLWEGTGDNPFVINSETGEIRLSFGPDREVLPSYTVTAVATDKARDPSTGLCTFTIIVDDVNDSRPRFRRNQYEVTVAANTPVGETVLIVEAEDADLNSNIEYILDENLYFQIIPTTGEVVVRSDLTPLSNSAPWSGRVTAKDGPNQSQQTLNIRVVDSTDAAPVFEPFANPITIPENFSTAAGENVLGVFRASILGLGINDDDRVSYSLLRGARPETNFPVKFTLNNDDSFTKATIILSERLDYETVQTIELEILAEGVVGSLPGFTTVTVNLQDVNDNPPRFPLVNFDATVKENAPAGTSVARVVAEDRDSTEEFRLMRYSIDQPPENRDWESFEIDENTGEITTTRVFDREVVKTYLINVVAENVVPLAIGTNVPNRAQTSVRIDVLDENDNEPVFADTSYYAVVDEDIGLGEMVIRVTATDEDEDSTLRYLITNGNTNGVFEVDPDSGVISVAVGLDYEKVENYTLEYSANDGLNSAITTIFITVNDVNDKRPEFDQLLYSAFVVEEDSTNIPRDLLQVTAEDGDTSATPVVYRLEGTGAGDIFTINRNTGWIRINKKVDREMQPVYNLVAVAIDENGNGLEGYSTVEVTVEDINDWAPRFPEVEYAGFVPENSPMGTTVMEVIAEDRDDPNTDNGRLSYAIEPLSDNPDDGSGLFSIDPDTGVVTTKVPSSQLDAEDKDTYVIEVTATDGTSTAVTTATITVEDVNDNPPVFDPVTYDETIPETLEVGTTAVEVMATDADETGRDEIEFIIINGNVDDVFGIYTDTPTLHGLIYPQKPLDFETEPTLYTLQVQVYDGTFSDTATVTIRLTDENEPPKFDQSTYTASVSEDISPGTPLLTVSATDEDNNDFDYFVDPATDPDGLFIMVGDELQVAPDKNLDRETTDSHTLNILATDDGIPPLSGTAVVELTVTDVDDTAPRFKEDYVGYVRENDTSVQWVAVVHAVDDDLTEVPPKFSYHIPSDQIGSEFFVGLENTGNNSYTIEKRPQVTIDREEYPSFDLIIRITDENSNTGDNILPIEVVDMNDNPHHPVTKNMLVYAFEGSVPLPGAVPNIGIGYVGVSDLDTLEDKTYTVVEGASKYINVDSDLGLVQIAEGTPATDDGEPYVLRVEVANDDGKYPTVTSIVVITIKEIPREAVFKSGSLRLSGVTPEEFISSRPGGSMLEKLTKLLSTITGAKEENIDIFTILPVEGDDQAVDVRYSAHGSPYYSADELNRDAERNIQLIEETLGVTVDAIYIDECATAECEADCSNVLEIDPQPVIVNALDASVVGINAYVVPFCGCAAREADVGTCDGHYCHNGGTCEDTFSGPRCKCEAGFDGPSCQGTTRSFRDGYTLLPTLKQCSETRTSVEFITEKSSGIIFYNGPTSDKGSSDYILLQLRDGKPLLNIDLGGGGRTLEVVNSASLSDGKWHKVDIFRNGLVVELVIDNCRTSSLSEDHVSSTSQRDSCSGNVTLPEGDIVFQSNQPLQLGGVSPEFKYPDILGLNSADGFEGCIRNLDQDSTLYDLHDVTQYVNSEPGCPRADRLCDALTPPCVNGICDADFEEAKCICNPGWTGAGCNQELDPYDFLDSSYVTYQLRAGLTLTDRESDYKIMVRTRMTTGLIWQITNDNTFEHVTMELVDGYLQSSWHLGDDTISVTLDKYPLNNGEWHYIAFYRYDNYVQIKVDGGGGVRQVENRDSTFRALQVDRESLIIGAELEYGVDVTNDFVGCVKDPRILDYYLGVLDATDWATPTAVAVEEGCRTDGCVGNNCVPPFVCFDIWRAFECRCPVGSSPLDGTCVYVEDCESEPCLNGGTCIETFTGYNCTCPKDFYGQNCEVERSKVVLTIGPSGILPIVACLLLLLLLLLLFIIYKRSEDHKNALAFAVDPEDDIRENFINYDEEDGEEDQTAFDVNTLRKPVHPSPIVARPVKPLEEVPRRAIPRDGVNVGDFLEERLGDTDDDPSAPPYDTLHTYDYEGEGSTAGSLSSLNSSSSDGSQDYDYLNDLGPPFKRLADMYGGVE